MCRTCGIMTSRVEGDITHLLCVVLSCTLFNGRAPSRSPAPVHKQQVVMKNRHCLMLMLTQPAKMVDYIVIYMGKKYTSLGIVHKTF